MAVAAQNFPSEQASLCWLLGPDRWGYAAYYIPLKAISALVDSGISKATEGLFQEPESIPSEKRLTKFFAQFHIRKISTSSELLEKIFNVAKNLAIFIPATLVAKEVVIAMGFSELAMVTTPLLTLLQQEATSLIAFEFFAHLIGLMIT